VAEPPLLGARVLIVEDDYWQAQDSRDRLVEAGAEIVAMTGLVPTALSSISSNTVDIGLLDVNLLGQMSFDVARTLVAKDVPVLFMTGYERNYLPADLSHLPVVTKPIEWPVTIGVICRMLGRPTE
jgi:DNA-binding response OmpR family regulator